MNTWRWDLEAGGRLQGKRLRAGAVELCYRKLLVVGLLSQDDCRVYVPKGKWVQG